MEAQRSLSDYSILFLFFFLLSGLPAQAAVLIELIDIEQLARVHSPDRMGPDFQVATEFLSLANTLASSTTSR